MKIDICFVVQVSASVLKRRIKQKKSGVLPQCHACRNKKTREEAAFFFFCCNIFRLIYSHLRARPNAACWMIFPHLLLPGKKKKKKKKMMEAHTSRVKAAQNRVEEEEIEATAGTASVANGNGSFSFLALNDV